MVTSLEGNPGGSLVGDLSSFDFFFPVVTPIVHSLSSYELFLTYDLPENVFEVFSALKSASENHMQAFQRQVDKLQ